MSFAPPPKLPQKTFIFYFIFLSKVNLGPSLRNGGLNLWSFQFWGYNRLGPRPKLPP